MATFVSIMCGMLGGLAFTLPFVLFLEALDFGCLWMAAVAGDDSSAIPTQHRSDFVELALDERRTRLNPRRICGFLALGSLLLWPAFFHCVAACENHDYLTGALHFTFLLTAFGAVIPVLALIDKVMSWAERGLTKKEVIPEL